MYVAFQLNPAAADAGVNPAFGDTFTIPIQQDQQNIQLEVWARHGGSDVMLGGSFVSLANLAAANGAVIRVQLSDQSGQPRGEVDCTGTITWETSSTDPSAPPVSYSSAAENYRQF